MDGGQVVGAELGLLIVPAVCIVLAILLQTFKEGQWRRNSRETQHELAHNAAELCGNLTTPSIVVPCDVGPHPMLAFVVMFLDNLLKSRAIVVCGASVFLLARTSGEARITKVIGQYSTKDVRIIRLSGLYGQVELGGEKIWIERKYFNDVRAIDPSSPGPTAPTTGW